MTTFEEVPTHAVADLQAADAGLSLLGGIHPIYNRGTKAAVSPPYSCALDSSPEGHEHHQCPGCGNLTPSLRFWPVCPLGSLSARIAWRGRHCHRDYQMSKQEIVVVVLLLIIRQRLIARQKFTSYCKETPQNISRVSNICGLTLIYALWSGR